MIENITNKLNNNKMKRPQTYASEPIVNGKYQVTKYNVSKQNYIPLKGEIYPFENIARERAQELNELEKEDLKENYEAIFNILSDDHDFWGIDEAIETYNELKSREDLLTEKESQIMSNSDKKIAAWNKRVNETGKIYQDLIDRDISEITSPYKYWIKGLN